MALNLSQLRVDDCMDIDSQKVVEITLPSETEDAFQTLVDRDILSAPVWDPSVKCYIGWCDMRDLGVPYLRNSAVFIQVSVMFAVSFVVNRFKQPTQVPKGMSSRRFCLKECLKAPTIIPGSSAAEPSVSYLCRRRPLVSVRRDAVLSEAAMHLTAGAHRLAVMEDEESGGRVCGVLSQSHLCRFISTCDWGEAAACTLRDCGFQEKPVYKIEASEPALKAFEIIDSKSISGVAVVDESGALVAATSGKDLSLWLQDSSDLSQVNIMEYLGRHEGSVALPVTCGFDEPLKAVLERMSAAKDKTCHRAFVVDKHGRPVSVMSLKDALHGVRSLAE